MAKKELFFEDCPNCGNEIEVPAKTGEVRKCPYCRRRYIVENTIRSRKILREYVKPGYVAVTD